MIDGGWFTPSLLMLPLQALAAAASVRIFARRVAPAIHRLHEPASAIDSLGPFALAMPLIVAGWRAGWNADGTTWIAAGAPIAIMLLGLGAAAVAAGMRATAVDDRSETRLRIPTLHAVTWSAVGGLLLLLGAAHDLTVWIGQCAFAVGAVLLWMNTPDLPRGEPDAVEASVGAGLTLVLLCAIVQAVSLALTPMPFLPVAAAMAIAHAGMIVALAARICAPAAAMRIGGWTATYGVLLGLGVISLRRLLPVALAMSGGDRELPPVKVAHSFGALALEASALLLAGGAALVIDRAGFARPLRIVLGLAIIVGAALLAAWRLASLL